MSWERLEKYRVKTGKTWQQVAEDIGLGRSMLMMVKSGRRQLSPKAIYRLEQAEIEAGIRTAPVLSEAPAEYVTRNQASEFRRDLNELRRDAAEVVRRADEMLKRIEKEHP